MGSGKKIVSGVVWTTLLNIINAVYGFIAVPILINHFGKAEYGLIGLAMSINVYMQLMDMGFNNTNIRFFSNWLAKGENENVNKGFQTSLSFYGIIGFLNALILIGMSMFSNSIFNVTTEQDVILKNLFYILAISAFFSWYTSCFDQLIKATENVAWIQRISIVPKILMMGVLFLTVYGNLSIELYYILTCLATFSMLPVHIWKIRKETPFISFKPQIDITLLKLMLPYCLNIFSFAIFQFSFYNLRPVFLGIQGSAESVADYRILNGIVGIVTMVGGAFMGALIPSTSKIIAQNNSTAFYKVAYDGTKYISIVLCFCCFGMMAIGKELLTIYVGKQYLYLIPWLNLWLICTLGTHNQSISSLILASDDIRAISYSSVFASLVGLFFAWYLIPLYGVGGTVIAFAIYLLIQLAFYYLYYWPTVMKINSLRIFRYSFFPYVLAGIIAFFFAQVEFLNCKILYLSIFLKGFCFFLIYMFGICVIMKKEGLSSLITLIKTKNEK